MGADKSKTKVMRIPLRILFLTLAGVVLSCDNGDFDPLQKDYNYFPLQKGLYHVFDVQEIRYALSVAETLNYQLKTVVVDSFPNNEGTFTYVIHRSKRTEPSDEWAPDETWSARIDRKEAIVTEGNVSFVVLNFPVGKGTKWDGNAYNTLINPSTGDGVDLYEITETGSQFETGNETYSDYIQVTQEDNQEFIVFQDKRIEIYGRNRGLLYKEITQLKYCNDEDRNCVGQQLVDEGLIYKQSLIEYGQD
jgi:hypothetical protein